MVKIVKWGLNNKEAESNLPYGHHGNLLKAFIFHIFSFGSLKTSTKPTERKIF